MPDHQLALRMPSQDKDRLREFRRGEEDAFTGRPRSCGTADYDAGYRTGLVNRADFLEIQQHKARTETRPARLHPLALRRLMGVR